MLRITKMPDTKIMACIKAGGKKENAAIEQLLTDNRKKINAYVLKNGGNLNDAEIVLVEGVTQFIFNIRNDKFRSESAIGTYLFAICRGIWLKSLKKNERFRDVQKDESIADSKPSPLESYNQKQLKDVVNLLLGRLGDSCGRVLRLWSMHYSMTEIANELGYKNSQIAMNKKNKCLTKLKEMVRESAIGKDLIALYTK